jgi:3-phosphoshikimate 1-carboxyvinyltransferase
MDITIHPRPLQGEIKIIPSKSIAHRYLICAAFADQQTDLICSETNQDIEATAKCLSLICHCVVPTSDGYEVTPYGYEETPFHSFYLNCHESGSTLRFLLPIVGALGADTTFKMEGRLPQRPLSPLWEEMERMGCSLKWIRKDELRVTGKLRPGDYYIDGGVSSQFITGLLFAASLLDGDSTIHITGNLESKPYVDMTQQAMKLFGVDTEGFHVKGGQSYRSSGIAEVEGDWSNGAFFLAANALGSKLDVLGLNSESAQGDRAVVEILKQLEEGMPTISAKDIPDLVPILSVVAAAKHGAVFTDIRRLRLKESDRVASTIAMIENLGGKAESGENTLKIYGTGLIGGTVDAVNDHRIAMATAIAATVCKQDVAILGAECVKKSYLKFWEEYARLGGKYEKHIR